MHSHYGAGRRFSSVGRQLQVAKSQYELLSVVNVLDVDVAY